MAHELNIGTINGMTVEEILDMMANKGIGVANPGVVFPTQPALGGIITIGDYKYRIVEVNSTTGIVYVALAYWQENCRFDNGNNHQYSGSDIANKCTTWYNNEVPQNLKDKDIFIDVNVSNVVSKCFIPSTEQIDPNYSVTTECFDYYRNYGSRIFSSESGTVYDWWTSSANNSTMNTSLVYVVAGTGYIDGSNNNASDLNGFRPHLAISISAFATGTVSA